MADTTPETPDTTATPDTPDTTVNTEAPDTTESTTESTPKTFTQEQVDAIVGARLAKANKRITELEQTQPPADTETRIAQLEQQLQAQQAAHQATLTQAALKDAALAAGIPVSKLPAALRIANTDNITTDGQPDTEAAKQAIAEVLQLVPELAAGGTPAGTGTPAGNGPAKADATPKEPATLADALRAHYHTR